MKWLRLFLLLELIALTVYTVWVVQVHGWSFLPYFLDNLTAVNWSGQFNLDFLMVLSLLEIARCKGDVRALLLGVRNGVV